MIFDLHPEEVFRAVDITAIATSGLIGGTIARTHRFDLVGFLLLATITGMGGGLIRDTLLNTGIPVALTDGAYWITAIITAVLAYLIDFSAHWAQRTLLFLDFLGMGCWVATGTLKALNVGLHWFPSICLGIVTAVGGGMLRDIMINRIPSIFGGNELYATVALLGASATAICYLNWDAPNLAMFLSILLCTVFGLVSHWRNWQLPEPKNLQVRRLLALRRPAARGTTNVYFDDETAPHTTPNTIIQPGQKPPMQ